MIQFYFGFTSGIRTKRGPRQQYLELFQAMQAQFPTLTAACLQLSQELQRISLLWEEEWQITLPSVQNALQRIWSAYTSYVKQQVQKNKTGSFPISIFFVCLNRKIVIVN